MVKKLFYILSCISLLSNLLLAQTINNTTIRDSIKPEPIFKNHIFSIGILSDGWGYFGYEYQFGKKLNTKKLLGIQFNEKKHPKELSEKINSDVASFNIIYGKQNICYPLHLYYGKTYTLGMPNEVKGLNIFFSYKGGISFALMRPYYITTQDTSSNPDVQKSVNLRYSKKDSLYFFEYAMFRDNPPFLGWNELNMIMGIHLAASLDFDFGHLTSKNTLMGVRITSILEWYLNDLPIMVPRSNIINTNFFLGGQLTLYYGFSTLKNKKK